MDIEVFFESKGRFRVFRLLLREGQANISRIVRETGLPHRLVKRHLKELLEKGLVKEKQYGRLKLYEVDLRDPAVNATKRLLDELESIWRGR